MSGSIIGSFVAVWQALVTFLVGLFPNMLDIFYTNDSLTFVGVMAVIMAGVSLILLVWNLIRSFFAMHG